MMHQNETGLYLLSGSKQTTVSFCLLMEKQDDNCFPVNTHVTVLIRSLSRKICFLVA